MSWLRAPSGNGRYSAVLVGQLAMTAGHHNERDGAEQARESANNDDDKHDFPSAAKCSGSVANSGR